MNTADRIKQMSEEITEPEIDISGFDDIERQRAEDAAGEEAMRGHRTLNWYQEQAQRTATREEYPDFVTKAGRRAFDISTFALGVAGEAGEVADLLKKGIYHGHGISVPKVKKELGDVLWYVAALAGIFGLTLQEVAEANVEKLKARYPAGFSTEASKNRKAEE